VARKRVHSLDTLPGQLGITPEQLRRAGLLAYRAIANTVDREEYEPMPTGKMFNTMKRYPLTLLKPGKRQPLPDTPAQQEAQ
jgi:hypothetical protein